MRTRIILLTGLAAIVAAFVSAIPTSAQQAAADAPTFTKDVAPVLFKNCVTCHRPGEAAPMSLLTYEQARPYAKAIANAVVNRTMPPWHADAPPGTFHNERQLTESERQTLVDWSRAGAPKGDHDLPPAPTFVDGWAIGKPDLVLQMLEDRAIPARGTIEYEHFYVPTNLTETKWVKAIEVRPGNRAVVHHVLLRTEQATPNASRLIRANPKNAVVTQREGVGERPRRAPAPGMSRSLISTYAPGTNPQVAPAGTAFRLEPGSVLEIQMHYTTNGQATTDRTSVGFVFSDEPSPRELRGGDFFNAVFTLPAGSADVSVGTDVEFLADAVVFGIFPHTHVRGTRWDYKLVMPGGEQKPILAVPRYDFNWQTYYMFKEPLQVPKGAKIISTAWYDNSAANKNNPDPKVDVKWGDQTWEEMQYSGILISQN